ncbi:hypothetical protein E2C01_023628 [Portunus trituberculatus]|uniref:Uncharacterized protein n=1 Tax=Portunus trituberculatus TaxID=210409 RepID=A0A5B7EAJ4_PORTR|nr:hypothetical protein [Portunus trituberculatus]
MSYSSTNHSPQRQHPCAHVQWPGGAVVLCVVQPQPHLHRVPLTTPVEDVLHGSQLPRNQHQSQILYKVLVTESTAHHYHYHHAPTTLRSRTPYKLPEHGLF